MEPKVGFIGLGQMGKPMAINVLKAGFKLIAYDLKKESLEELTVNGGLIAASPKEVALHADWIVLSLPNTEAAKAVIFEPDGIISGIHDGLVIIDCGTTDFHVTREIANILKERRIDFIDAPVSGMRSRAIEGTLTIMVGGEEGVFKRIEKVLAAFGSKIIYMGQSGSGQLAKLANQLLFNINTAAFAEVLPMAVKMGLDPEKVCQVIQTGTGRSFASEFFAPLILENNFGPGYQLANAYKDMISAFEISSRNKIPLPIVAAATLTYQLALADGLGNENKGAMIKVWEKVIGVKVRKKEMSDTINERSERKT